MASFVGSTTSASSMAPVKCSAARCQRASISARPAAVGLRSTAFIAPTAALRSLSLGRFPAPKGRMTSHVVSATISTNDFKNGLTIEIDGAPYRVTEFLHVKPGKGSAFVRSKLRNYLTGNTVEKTFRAGEKVNTADIQNSGAQFSYMDGDQYVFMDMTSFEETRVDKDDSWAKWLVEGMDVKVLRWNDTVIGVSLPQTVTLKVADCDPGIKGNTAAGGSKPATLETGAQVQVPLFVEIGDDLIINTEEGKYLSRATE